MSHVCFVQHAVSGCADDCLDELVQKFWETEEVAVATPKLSPEEEDALQAVKTSLSYTNERYKVGIPWKLDPEILPDNYEMALKRLKDTEKKLSKNDTILAAYEDVIAKYLEKNYIRKVPEEDISKSKWYLPHFPVVNMDRSTTKVRLVFDASAKCSGISLNDVIHQGPKMQNDLFEILLRFRRYPVGLICDVAEMYLQIEIAECDRPYFRFLWRSNDQVKPPVVYEFSRVVFGINCSPFLAQYITQEHAKLHETDLTMASTTVVKSTYMDDSIDSVQTDIDALQLYNQLMNLWGAAAGMHARKWLSNSKNVLNEIPAEDRLQEISILTDELPSVKTLGLVWCAEADEFNFGCSSKQIAHSDKEILSQRNC
ncbi:uncharacterized protein LOC124265388 [Haliotis rubra]|uniref:uncharacterized protein LOC124265388 n=1 Tax=Haliotis rubra TaxID=36100 RepID=UPI001EE610CC|nr:uncharacterized protein LOC124265388 [Haliotis rubra]